jgi:hypothetical protein
VQQILIANLHEYLTQNNIDLFVSLEAENKVSTYLKDKVDAVGPLVDELLAESAPPYIIQERCMDELTKDLRPSRFNYIISILDEEFETDFNRFEESGILTYEVINLIEVCKPVFEALGFTVENENDKSIHNAIIGAVKEYLKNKQ